MQKLQAQQFKTEFITQAEATIIPKVTMTQFMIVIACCVFFFGFLHIPMWLSPLPLILGYVVGYRQNGELIFKRILAFITIFVRQHTSRPRHLNLQTQWDVHEANLMRQQGKQKR
jgi:hypothetical protein